MILSYLKFQEEYGQKYGEENTIVLYQVGTFYECYLYDPEKDESSSSVATSWPTKKIGNAIEVGTLLNMVVTKRDKNKPYGLNNCNLVGFPIVAYDKHKQVLLNNGYTIIRMDQKKDGKEIERVVAEIVSASTNIENISSSPISNNIVNVFIEVLKESYNFEDYSIAVGISSIDVTTGENKIVEIYSKECDNICAIQEIYRFLSSSRPIETLIHLTYKCSSMSSKDKQLKDYEQFLISNLDLSKYIFFINKIDPEFLKIDYSTRFLSKIFMNSSKILINPNIIEELGLERTYYGMISYILLLQYCYEHNPSLIERLNRPEICNNDKYLVLTHNAINQIDLLPSKNTNNSNSKHNRSNKNIDSLFSVINYTKTALGKRYLLNILTRPITDPIALEKNYDMITDLIGKVEVLDFLTNVLKNIPDVERYQRKLYLKLIKPNEFAILFKAYISIISIYTKILQSNSSLNVLLFDPSEFNECLSLVLSKIKIDLLSNCKIENERIITDEKIFYDGTDVQADKYWKELENGRKNIENIVEELNSHLGNTKGKKIEYTKEVGSKEVESHGFWTTPHKATVLSKSSINTKICGDIKIVNANKDVMITSDLIATVLSNYHNIEEELSKYLYSCYMTTLSNISHRFNFFSIINSFISKVDYLCSGAKAAIENKYFRPTIEAKENSYCQILEMRHPIVEAIISGEYVPNDIYIGGGDIRNEGIRNENKGILLYGENSSGKSTLVKAVALNIILAQCGLFTAGKTTFYPYTKMITRLSGNDNILHNESSFVVEMKELRTILRNADSSSLILGDEIARGTESISASSISISTLMYLIEKKSSFIFTSHLHNIVDMKEVVNLGSKLKIAHLSLQYIPESNMIIYERKLKDGPGESVYGLEIASSLGLDSNFIRKAYEIRNEIVKNSLFLSNKKSKHNSKVYVDCCFLCGKNEIDKLQTHHIKEQEKADEKGFIGITHKNIPGNLIDICSECHSRLHSNGLSIVSQETSKGIALTLIS